MKILILYVAIIFSGSIHKKNKNLNRSDLQQFKTNKNHLIKQEKARILEFKQKNKEKTKLTFQIKEKETKFNKMEILLSKPMKQYEKSKQQKIKSSGAQCSEENKDFDISDNLKVFEQINKVQIEISKLLFELITIFSSKKSLTKRLAFLADGFNDRNELLFNLNEEETGILNEVYKRFDEIKKEALDDEYKFKIYYEKFKRTILNCETIGEMNISKEKTTDANKYYKKDSKSIRTKNTDLTYDLNGWDDIMNESPSILTHSSDSYYSVETTNSPKKKSPCNSQAIISPSTPSIKNSLNLNSKNSLNYKELEQDIKDKAPQALPISAKSISPKNILPTKNITAGKALITLSDPSKNVDRFETVFNHSYEVGAKKEYIANLKLKKTQKKKL
ncbi:hypothetical protein CWI37_0352p0010 [Hamiltosporidium tvaerminnensis]|uniref:Uncharacterized protein n=1 Tax=Hamiltosporidium tvaerminnensis TaxID=1176355 RepID=A0A4Q9L7C6_9MICR|nr:hypothetical protein CWI37_0352p0010 [Hamiltosporidium tvaerminnensis]